MSSTKRPAGSLQSGAALSAAGPLLLSALLAAGVPVARGQDAVPAARPAANPVAVSGGARRGSKGAAASGDTTDGSPASGAQAAAPGAQTEDGAQGTAPGAQSASGTNQNGDAQQASGGATAAPQPGSASKPQPVCFPLTGRCVEGAKASKANKHNAPKDGSSAQRPLNLSAPDVRTVVSADELKEPLPSNDQIAEVQEADTVSVKSEGVPTDVPGGFGAIWWALNHPSQAWKIVVPY